MSLILFLYRQIEHNIVCITGLSSANRKLIKVEFSGDITKINRVTFVDENGETLIDNVGFMVNKSKTEDLTDDVENIETDADNELSIEAEEIPHIPFYIRVNGKDINGTLFFSNLYPQRTCVSCRK